MQVFIDANIYLDYFRKSEGAALASLKEFKKLLHNKKINLVLPSQTKDEYIRQYDNIVEKTRSELLALKNLYKAYNFPAEYINNWQEAKKLKTELKKFQNIHNKTLLKMIAKYDQMTDKEDTEADKLINNIFSVARFINEDELILQKAHTRCLKGNPPGKGKQSYGDAIIWESLLEEAIHEDLTIITRDADFIEDRKEAKVLRSFLMKEWKAKSQKSIKLFVSLAEFINHYSKKEVVDKDIVESEKLAAMPIYSYPNTMVRGALNSMVAFNADQITRLNIDTNTAIVPNLLSLDGRSSAMFTADQDSVLGYLGNRSANKIKFCPYCGYKLEDIYLQLYPLQSEVACKQCGQSISL